MGKLTLEAARIGAGRWEAELTAPGEAAPALELWHREARLAAVEVGPPLAPGRWPVAAPIPAEALCDGVQTFLVRDAATGDTLGHFTIIAGAAMDDDIRAEIDLLRAELDLLKAAFRRHCVETGGR